MSKAEFLTKLRESLSGLAPADINTSMEFYSEIIDDRMEEGLSEEEAVACLGSIDDIRDKVLEAVPITKIVKEKIKPGKPMSALAVILLIIGFPLWFPLVIAGSAVTFTIYLVFWILILCLIVVNFSALICGGALIVQAFVYASTIAGGMFLFGIGLASFGAAILLFHAFRGLANLLIAGSKLFLLGLKKLFI